MEGRLSDALNLIINKVPKETKHILECVLDLDAEINSGYMDWNDWNDYYEDDSEDGLMAYLKEIFNIKEEK